MNDSRKQIIFSIIDKILEDKKKTDNEIGKCSGLSEVDKSVFEYVDEIVRDRIE